MTRGRVAGLAAADAEYDLGRAVCAKVAAVNPQLAEALAAHLTQALRDAVDGFGDATVAGAAAVVRGRAAGRSYARPSARAHRGQDSAAVTAGTATSTAGPSGVSRRGLFGGRS